MMAGMRGWRKALFWAWILLACAGIGAFIASRSNPFPPGVRDTGAQPSQSHTPSPTPEEVTPWVLTMASRTIHRYRVGGSCTSDWRMKARIRVSEDGRVVGRGAARLRPGAGCDFPSAQVQTTRVDVRIVGRRDGGALDLRFRDRRVEPAGSQDLGGFIETLRRIRFLLPERTGANVSERARVEDLDGEIHAAVTEIRLSR